MVSKEQEPPIGYFTADGVVYFGVPNEQSPHRVHEIAQSLFGEAPALYWRLVYGMLFESPSEIEEEALRWRTARLGDLGFPDREQAMRVYRPLQPEKVAEWSVPTDSSALATRDPPAAPAARVAARRGARRAARVARGRHPGLRARRGERARGGRRSVALGARVGAARAREGRARDRRRAARARARAPAAARGDPRPHRAARPVPRRRDARPEPARAPAPKPDEPDEPDEEAT